MWKDYFWLVLSAIVLSGRLLAWLASRLFARHCYYTGIDHERSWTMGVIGWATLIAYWCLLIGGLIVLYNSRPMAWLALAPGLAAALFVVLRFRRYWRRRGI